MYGRRRTGCKTPKENAQILLWMFWATKRGSYLRIPCFDLQVEVDTEASLGSMLNRGQRNIDVCGKVCLLPIGILS